MRLWLTYILHNTNLAEDFVSDMTTRANNLLSLQNQAILDDEMENAKFIAHEAKVYTELGNTVNRELKEARAQLDHENAQQYATNEREERNER